MNTTENLDLNVDIENNKNHQENAKLMNCENSQKLDTNSTDLKENRIGTQICDTNIDDNDDDSTSYSSLSSFESVDATNDDNEVGEGDEDPERDDTLPTEVPKSANEISVHELREEPINITLTENDAIELIGHVLHIVDEFVVIQSKSGSSALDLESLLCLEDRTIIGRVHETFGKVESPFYSVYLRQLDKSTHQSTMKNFSNSHHNNNKETVQNNHQNQSNQTNRETNTNTNTNTSTNREEIKEPSTSQEGNQVNVEVSGNSSPLKESTNTSKEILSHETQSSQNQTEQPKKHSLLDLLKPGTPVFYVPKYSRHVHWKDVWQKGYDASNEFDEEVPVEELEFSDDEKEAEFKAKIKQKKRKNRKDTTNSTANTSTQHSTPSSHSTTSPNSTHKKAKFEPFQNSTPSSLPPPPLPPHLQYLLPLQSHPHLSSSSQTLTSMNTSPIPLVSTSPPSLTSPLCSLSTPSPLTTTTPIPMSMPSLNVQVSGNNSWAVSIPTPFSLSTPNFNNPFLPPSQPLSLPSVLPPSPPYPTPLSVPPQQFSHFHTYSPFPFPSSSSSTYHVESVTNNLGYPHNANQSSIS